jgi:hypothetical protein
MQAKPPQTVAVTACVTELSLDAGKRGENP